jgi:hypothetical protein
LYFGVPKPPHLKAKLLQRKIARVIAGGTRISRVTPAIELHDQAVFETSEINNEFTYWDLPAKMEPRRSKRA